MADERKTSRKWSLEEIDELLQDSGMLPRDSDSVIDDIIQIEYFEGGIYIDSTKFLEWKRQNQTIPQYELCGVLPLREKEPTICLFEDGNKVREYCLQTDGDEDFSGKYFFVSVRIGFYGNTQAPVAQIDGFGGGVVVVGKCTLCRYHFHIVDIVVVKHFFSNIFACHTVVHRYFGILLELRFQSVAN